MDPSTLQRLALIRYLFGAAEQQARQPEPLSSVAILHLHDGVELFLHLAAEQTNAAIGRNARLEFAEYFGQIDAVIKPNRLSQRAAMVRLNTARVAFKHHGNTLGSQAVEQHRAAVERFFEANTPLVFGVEFGAVSLVDLVRFPRARASLAEAERALSSGDTAAAMLAIATAFAQLVDDYERETRLAYGRSPFVFGESFVFDRSFFRHRARSPFGGGHAQAEFEDKLMNSVVALQRGMKVLSLGLDYRRYAKFRLLSPPVTEAMRDGTSGPRHAPDATEGRPWPPTAESCRYCFDFVIESALRLQEVAFADPQAPEGPP